MSYEVLSESGIRKVLDWPYVDLDTTFVWIDGIPTQIVTTGLGLTKTRVLTWLDYELQSDATVIT